MKRWLLLLIGCALSLGAAKGEDDPTKALERLRGTWEIVKAEGMVEARRMIIDQDTATMEFDKDDAKKAKYKADPSAKPPRIDITYETKTMQGIYELDGDNLKLCLGDPDGERPTEFKAAKGRHLITLKRVKK
jgi:uncharacterized protein (TIGR03067 family)